MARPSMLEAVKTSGRSASPRSLTVTLPRRFCFQRTTDAPRMLVGCPVRKVRRAVKARTLPWNRLDL